MPLSLSKLVDNLSAGIQNNKCLNCKCFLDYIKIKNEKLLLKCLIAILIIKRNLIKI